MKASEWKYINVPKYPELNAHTFYEYVKKKPELSIYFPDYKKSQKSERQFLFNIIGNNDPDFLNAKIDEAYKKRMWREVAEDSEKIEIRADILEELMKTNYESSKFHWYIYSIESKWREIYLLKKSSKLDFARRKRKTYKLNLKKEEDKKKLNTNQIIILERVSPNHMRCSFYFNITIFCRF